ncbi:hypothetical protein AB1Y20_008524 [Prymnesium parvum]|uniref:Uncharacterized protein n=1 Tax=Prymnesium parvum TaxID=97485 RepID=A0AB34IRD2_PRYPA
MIELNSFLRVGSYTGVLNADMFGVLDLGCPRDEPGQCFEIHAKTDISFPIRLHIRPRELLTSNSKMMVRKYAAMSTPGRILATDKWEVIPHALKVDGEQYVEVVLWHLCGFHVHKILFDGQDRSAHQTILSIRNPTSHIIACSYVNWKTVQSKTTDTAGTYAVTGQGGLKSGPIATWLGAEAEASFNDQQVSKVVEQVTREGSARGTFEIYPNEEIEVYLREGGGHTFDMKVRGPSGCFVVLHAGSLLSLRNVSGHNVSALDEHQNGPVMSVRKKMQLYEGAIERHIPQSGTNERILEYLIDNHKQLRRLWHELNEEREKSCVLH